MKTRENKSSTLDNYMDNDYIIKFPIENQEIKQYIKALDNFELNCFIELVKEIGSISLVYLLLKKCIGLNTMLELSLVESRLQQIKWGKIPGIHDLQTIQSIKIALKFLLCM